MEDKRLEDFGPEKFNGEEKVFIEQKEFRDFDKPKHYSGKAFSIIALVLSLVSFVYALGGFFWATVLLSGGAVLIGLIALIRKHSDPGVAMCGAIIAGVILGMSIWSYIDGSEVWRDNRDEDDRETVDVTDMLPQTYMEEML